MARQHDDDNDAPWLAEAVPPARTRVSRRSLFWTVLIFLGLAAVVVAGTVLLVSKKDTGSTQGYMNAEQAPLILAEPGPYKVEPLDPKGLAVEGQDQTLYAAGEGIDQGSVIDENARPEDLLPRPGTVGPPIDLIPEAALPEAAPAPPPAALPPPVTVVRPTPPLPARPKPPEAVPAARPGTVQLGAFSTEAKASAAWTQLAGRHGMAGFSKQVSATQSSGQTLWRLRGSGGDAAALCAKLKSAGDPCTVVN